MITRQYRRTFKVNEKTFNKLRKKATLTDEKHRKVPLRLFNMFALLYVSREAVISARDNMKSKGISDCVQLKLEEAMAEIGNRIENKEREDYLSCLEMTLLSLQSSMNELQKFALDVPPLVSDNIDTVHKTMLKLMEAVEKIKKK